MTTHSSRTGTWSRRSVLGAALSGLAGATAGCASGRPSSSAAAGEPPASPSDGSAPGRVLLAYFSRAGENYHYGGRRDLRVGNTEVLAGVISGLTGCDVHRIEATDPYPEEYAATVRRNTSEQDTDARPGITNPLLSIQQYDTVLLASPIWGGRAPMLMTTFTEALTFTGAMVHPVTTHAMSGLGTTERDYAASCRGARLGEGLAVQGERVSEAKPAVEAWLRRINLLSRKRP